MIGYLGVRSVRGLYRSYRRSRTETAHKGPWTFTALTFTALTFTALATTVAGLQRSAAFWPWLGAAMTLAAVLGLSSGVLGRVSFERAVNQKYDRVAARRTTLSPRQLRERAELLEELEEQQGALAARAPQALPSPEKELLAAVLSRACPVPVCLAPPPLPCPMGAGVPVALVRRNPVAFCHLLRIKDAVDSGAVSRDDISAQFAGQVPEGVL